MGLLIAYILGLLTPIKKPPQRAEGGISPTTNSKQENEGGDSLPAFKPQVIPTPTNAKDSCYCCHQKTPLWKIILDWLTFLGVVGTVAAATWYACITHEMWKEMQTQTKIQRQASINSERAWVGLDGPIKTEALQATPKFVIGGHYEIKNFGHGPALKVFPSAVPVWDSEGNVDYMNVAESSCAGPIEFATGTLPHPPGTPNPAPGPMGYTLFPGQSHPEEVGPWQGQAVPPLKHFWFIGCVAYLDQFKSLHWTRFCVESPFTIPNPTKDTPLQFCALYNDAGDGKPPS